MVLKLRARAGDGASKLVEVISFSTVMVVERPEDEEVCENYIPRKPGDFNLAVEAEERHFGGWGDGSRLDEFDDLLRLHTEKLFSVNWSRWFRLFDVGMLQL